MQSQLRKVLAIADTPGRNKLSRRPDFRSANGSSLPDLGDNAGTSTWSASSGYAEEGRQIATFVSRQKPVTDRIKLEVSAQCVALKW